MASTRISPVEAPLQSTFCWLINWIFNTAGCSISIVWIAVQLNASVTVTMYVPAASPVTVFGLAVVLAWVTVPVHAKLYGAVPPEAVTDALPSLISLQVSSTSVVTERVRRFGSLISNDPLAVQPLASVTV